MTEKLNDGLIAVSLNEIEMIKIESIVSIINNVTSSHIDYSEQNLCIKFILYLMIRSIVISNNF